jgi:hypothetical protein
MIAILIGMRWNLGVVLLCISFRGMDSEYFLIYLLVICTFLKNASSFAHLLIGLFILLVNVHSFNLVFGTLYIC